LPLLVWISRGALDTLGEERTVAHVTNLEESPEHPPFPDRLRTAFPVTLPLLVTPAEAVDRLRLALETGTRVDVGRGTTDRRLTGEITEQSVRLSVLDADWAHRRKGWKIEFLGRFEQSPAPTVLRGTVDTNPRRIRGWIRFMRALAVVPFLLGIASAFGLLDGSDSPTFALLFGLGVSLFASWAGFGLQDSIERAAADDARVLVDFLRSRLR
jgi:hypothetical protein